MIKLRTWTETNTYWRKEHIKEYARFTKLTGEEIQSLTNSLDVVTKFFVEAHKVAQKKQHYSARTLIEIIRHHSMLEDGDKAFKINNNLTKPLAIISMELFPALNGLFSIRTHTFSKEN